MNKRPLVWMNVTTSANWRRPPQGIVRVEQELCRGLSSIYGSTFRQCVLCGDGFVRYPQIGFTSPEVGPKPSNFVPDESYELCSHEKLADETDATLSHTDGKFNQAVEQFEQIDVGDTIISVGLDWEHPQIGKILYDLKHRKGVNVVTFCHDLIPLLFPQYCTDEIAEKFSDYYLDMVWSSSLILCNSICSQRDLTEFCHSTGLPVTPTVVMPLGGNIPVASNAISDRIAELATQDYILYVSTIERRKNHEVLYRALHLLAREQKLDGVPKIVFVGMPGWGVSDLLRDIELDPVTKGLIVQFHRVNDSELHLLYENCKFVVYPSLYEGWGLPVAEALSFGKMVLASASGSIPEVGGNLVEYLDPWCPREWALKIKELYNNSEIVRMRELAIRSNYVSKSWTDAAKVATEAIEALRKGQNFSRDLYPGYDLSTQAGLPFADRILSNGKNGVLAHGPYLGMPAGKVTVDIYLSKYAPSTGNMCIRLTSGDGKRIHSELNLKPEDILINNSVFRMNEVELETSVNDLEIFIYIEGDWHISFNKLSLFFLEHKLISEFHD